MLAKKPAMVILLGILLLNVVFVAVSAVVIYALAPAALQAQGMGACVYYTVSMILDAGFMAEVVQDVGVAGYGLIIACIAIGSLVDSQQYTKMVFILILSNIENTCFLYNFL